MEVRELYEDDHFGKTLMVCKDGKRLLVKQETTIDGLVSLSLKDVVAFLKLIREEQNKNVERSSNDRTG